MHIIALTIILINPKIGLEQKNANVTRLHVAISVLLGLFVGFYAGIFGGGVNVFIIFSFIFIFGNTFLQATANSKLPNLIITAVSIPMFIIKGFISWEVAIPLALSTTVGSYFGARLAFERGNRFIRLLFIGLVVLLAIKYLI